MLEAVWKHGVLFYAVGVMCVLGIFSKIIVSLTLRKLVREAGRMGKSVHPLMKLVRSKFEHACMVSDRVQNIRAFVDKYLYEYKVLWIKLHSWRQMEKAAAWCCLIFGCAGAAAAYAGAAGMETVGRYAVAGAAGALLLFALRMVTDENYQFDAVKNYMLEFLENTYSHRYEKMSVVPETEYAEANRKVQEEEDMREGIMEAQEAEEEEPEALPAMGKPAAYVTEDRDMPEKEEDMIESDLVALMREEQEKIKEEEERRERRKRDEEMIREILAEFLT